MHDGGGCVGFVWEEEKRVVLDKKKIAEELSESGIVATGVSEA
jgi:hypothetical protein